MPSFDSAVVVGHRRVADVGLGTTVASFDDGAWSCAVHVESRRASYVW